MTATRVGARERRATARLQLTPGFGFDHAADLVDPLRRLGVSHLYLSPVAQAVPVSEHGYDVVDHRLVRAEFGGRAALVALLDELDAAGMAVIVDHVPNHVSVERPELNRPWWTMLRDGPDSPTAVWFDVDWEVADGRVILPRLADRLDRMLDEGGLEVIETPTGHELHVGALRLPVRTGTHELALPELLAAQFYDLRWWRSPARTTRRFFTIDDLVAVRVEIPEVRDVVDSIPLSLRDHPAFDGVRIDHVDGLADPNAYLAHLRDALGDRWILVEKILGPGETLPASWPVDGTTGYEFVVDAEHVLADPAGRPVLERFRSTSAPGARSEVDSAAATHDAEPYHRVELEARREVLAGGLAPDLDRLLRTIDRAVRRHTGTADGDGDPSAEDRRRAVVETTVALDRYRTYLPDDEGSHEVFAGLIEQVTDRHPELRRALTEFADLVASDDEVRTRWQQLTGPAMAKGAEDRAFFRHHLLAGWNEVGGRPDLWDLSVDEFHERRRSTARRSPQGLSASTTHDTKRSSGVRARSLALSEHATAVAFVDAVTGWVDRHPDLMARVDAHDVSLAAQTVVTAWPISSDRLGRFLVKCAREADLHTSWTDVDTMYEGWLDSLATALCTTLGDPSTDLSRVVRRAAEAGDLVGEALTVLHLTSPGVPDLYQGMPAVLLTLVDPDNRTEPDWRRWRSLVDRAVDGEAAAPDGSEDADLRRTRLTADLLALRGRHPDAFGPGGDAVPLDVQGPSASRVVTFSRTDGSGPSAEPRVSVVTVGLGASAEELAATVVSLPPGTWARVAPSATDDGPIVGGGGVSVGDLLGGRSAAVLERQDRPSSAG